LEIFQYGHHPQRPPPAANRPGFAHIAFAVADVPAAVESVLAAGGQALGQIVTLDVPGAGAVTCAYVTDPEGNILELQRWSSE
jgi:predicted enzyme related to lactoylglutathione lyase